MIANRRPYFLNHSTKTTSWTHPSALQNQSLTLRPSSSNNSAGSNQVESPTSSLCSSCSELFRGKRQEKALGVACPYPVPRNQTLLQVESSANEGCHLCHLRWGQLDSRERGLLEGCTRINYGFWHDAGGLGLAFGYHYPNRDHGQKKGYLTKSVLCLTKTRRLCLDL
jgi:hypothetical protein